MTYVDDYLIFCKKEEVLHNLIQLFESKFKLTDKGYLASFLGIKLKRINSNTLELA